MPSRLPIYFSYKHKIGIFFLGVLSLAILVLEFSFNLNRNAALRNIAVGLDLVLIAWYFFHAFKVVRRYAEGYWAAIKSEQADALYFILVCSVVFMPRLAAGFIVARLIAFALMALLESSKGERLILAMNLRPSQTLALGFVGLIAIGSLLLTFPAATTNGAGIDFLEAIFTMTSATCVSGLSIINVAADLTRFGQAVVLLAIQVGGLGIMVLSASFAVLVGGQIASRKQAGLKEVLDISGTMGLRSLIKSVTASTVFFEFVGAVVLFFAWGERYENFSDRLWSSIFHSVSAFCNAGISLFPNGMLLLRNDWVTLWTFVLLITVGGLGFFAIYDLMNVDVWEIKKPKAIWDRLQVQTKVILIATILLNAVGMLVYLYFEYDATLRGQPIGTKINLAIFQTVNWRSAGFSAVALNHMAPPTMIICIAYMFIGAAPGSTGGGIKITTAAVSIMALRAMLRGREDVEIFGRAIPSTTVSRSLSIVMIASIIVALFLTLLLATQNVKFENLFFETVSAFGTVGLSLNTSQELNSFGKLVIIFVMYVGRIGPLTLALAVGQKKVAQGYHLPKGSIAVG